MILLFVCSGYVVYGLTPWLEHIRNEIYKKEKKLYPKRVHREFRTKNFGSGGVIQNTFGLIFSRDVVDETL